MLLGRLVSSNLILETFKCDYQLERNLIISELPILLHVKMANAFENIFLAVAWKNVIELMIIVFLLIIKFAGVSSEMLIDTENKCKVCKLPSKVYYRLLDCYCIMCSNCAFYHAFSVKYCPLCLDEETTGVDETPVNEQGNENISA